MTYRVERPDGIRWMLARGKLLLGADCRPVRMIGIIVDDTERRNAEDDMRRRAEPLAATVEERTRAIEAEVQQRENAEAALRQAQKMEAVGQLTGCDGPRSAARGAVGAAASAL